MQDKHSEWVKLRMQLETEDCKRRLQPVQVEESIADRLKIDSTRIKVVYDDRQECTGTIELPEEQASQLLSAFRGEEAAELPVRFRILEPDMLTQETVLGQIEALGCLEAMAWYYRVIYSAIRHCVGDEKYNAYWFFSTFSAEEIQELRRQIDADLENLGIEFYLRRMGWALECRKAMLNKEEKENHLQKARLNPARHPCQMKKGHGFRRVVEGGEYSFEDFLAETLPAFITIHAHLVAINRLLGDLYSFVAELPLASFTPPGKSEIREMTSELNRIMRGLLVATHLQPQADWQRDLVSFLASSRSDCLRFFETVPQYFLSHRRRLVVFPLELSPEDDAESGIFRSLPLTCLPWSSGVYQDFLTTYESLARHTLSVFNWSLRLYSRWYFVPKRYLQLISAIHPT